MCLSREGVEQVCRWAADLDDEQLHEADAHYRQKLNSTLDAHIHHYISFEIKNRRLFRQRQLRRSLWLSTRHGRIVEAIKRWLIRHRLWSSTLRWPRLPTLAELVLRVIALLIGMGKHRRRELGSAPHDQILLGRIARGPRDNHDR
jgi:hypothetical protein